MTIDWYDLTQKYNAKNHTDYESEREMIFCIILLGQIVPVDGHFAPIFFAMFI